MKVTVERLLEKKGREVFSVEPEDSVYDAIARMGECNVGALVVMKGDRLEGIISERDYARKVILQGRDSRSTKVREIMSTPVVTIGLEETVQKCMGFMTGSRIRHLPVLEGEKVVGLVSIGDIVRAIIEDQEFQIEQLEGYIKGGG